MSRGFEAAVRAVVDGDLPALQSYLALDPTLAQARSMTGNADMTLADLRRDEDVMDTWFSSWIWPIQVFDGLHKENEVAYYYPTNDHGPNGIKSLVTFQNTICKWT